MKNIAMLLLVFFLTFYGAAQDKAIRQPGDETAIKKDLLLSTLHVNSLSGFSMKEQLLMLNSKEEKDKSEQQQLENSVSQAEDFKLSTGLLYFAGAAAVAAIIYFLVPDNEPSSDKTYTFGLPVTPK